METRTLTLPRSSSMDSTEPRKSAKGPSMILTASPTEKVALYLGASIFMNFMMFWTSDLGRGVGLLPMPTKPVTP